MIEIQNVRKEYISGKENFVLALKDINITIPDNAFVSICGKSGSGKTTLLNVLSGIESVTTGKVIIDGVDINGLSDKEISKFRNDKIGVVFQSFLLEPSLTAFENVELPLILRKMSREERVTIVKNMLKAVGIETRMMHKPGELSGGERQRVAIARALCTSPRILIADEPTGNLDETTGKQIIGLMKELTKECTFILVTHDDELASSAPYQIRLKDGEIVEYIKEGKIDG